MKARDIVFARAALVLLLPSTAPAPARAEPPLTDAEVTARLSFIEDVLARERDATRFWHHSWLAFFAGATLAQGGLVAIAPDRGARVVGLVGGAKSAIAFTFLMASPTTAETAADELGGVPADTPSARLVKLRHAEARLRTIADEERFRRGWFPAIGGALVNLAGAFITWSLTRGPVPGWVGLGSGIIVSHVQRVTQPTAAMRAWEAYARGRADARLPSSGPSFSLAPLPGGVALQATF